MWSSDFEKHIGVKSKKFGLNNYSITPTKFEEWYLNFLSCKEILGTQEKIIDKQEINTLNKLQRGVYAKENLKKGQILNKRNTIFCISTSKKSITHDKI